MKQFFSASFLPLLLFVTSTSSAQSDKTKPAIVMNHLAFQVNDLKASTAFYINIIGLDSIPEPFHDGRHTWLSLGNGSHLHLIKSDSNPIIPGKNTHLCLSVASVAESITKLQLHKIPYEDWAGTPMSITHRVDGVQQIYLKDPDGYWLEINDATE